MIKINLNGNQKFQKKFDEIQAYKERTKQVFGDNKEFMLLTMSKMGFTKEQKNPCGHPALMAIEGSGYEQTRGRGFDDQIMFQRVGGKLKLIVSKSCKPMAMKRIWLMKFLTEKAREYGLMEEEK